MPDIPSDYFETASRLKAIIDTAIDGIITISDRGIIETVNSSAAAMFGYMPDEVIGNNVNMLMPSPHRDRHDSYLDNYSKTRNPKIIGIGREVDGLMKDGTIIHIHLAVSEVRLTNRTIYTGIVHDISELTKARKQVEKLNEKLELKVIERTEKLAEVVNKLLATNEQLEREIQERIQAENALLNSEKELRRALEKEKELGALKSRFVSMASHEFRTPLSTILSSTALIGRYKKETQQTERDRHIERIKKAVNNLTGILDDFLSLSRLEEGKIEYQPIQFSFCDFCTEVIDELKVLLKKGQKIVTHHPPKDPILFVDRRLLKNVFYNIFSNAVKYSDEKTTIYCTNEVVGDQLVIQIKDEGIGIPPKDQQHLFTRFFRAANAANIQGTGLGLNIVKRYLDLMNGTIHFKSTVGEGSTFTIQLAISN